MAWLLAGSALLVIAISLPDPPSRAARILAFLLLLAAFAGGFAVYADHKVLAAVGGGAVAGFGCARLSPRPPRPTRLAAIAVGAAFVAFSLFGPAGGLF